MSRTLIAVLILICSSTALAGFDKLVKDVFPSGTMSNSTAAAVVKEQQAGHYLGGSVVIRSPAEPKLHPITAREPHHVDLVVYHALRK